MENHLSLNDIERYGARAMPLQELLSADRHLAECAQCHATLGSLSHSQYSIVSIQNNLRQAARDEVAHLTFETLEAYAEGRADPAQRKLVDSHTATCRMCAREVDELQRFASAMAADAVRKPEIIPLPFWQRLPGFFGFSSNRSFSMAAVSAVAIVLLLGATVSYIYFQSYRAATPPIARTGEPENPSPTKPQPANRNDSTPQEKPDSTPEEAVAPVPQPEKKAAPVIAFFVLKPTGTREGGAENTLTVPINAEIVQIFLGVEGEDYSSYQTEVRTLQGKRIWSHRLKPRKTNKGKALVLQIPANLLKQDAYSLQLTGKTADGSSEELDEYFFTIKR